MHKLDPIISKVHYKTLTVSNSGGCSATLTKDGEVTTLELSNHKLLINGEEGDITNVPKDVDHIVLN